MSLLMSKGKGHTVCYNCCKVFTWVCVFMQTNWDEWGQLFKYKWFKHKNWKKLKIKIWAIKLWSISTMKLFSIFCKVQNFRNDSQNSNKFIKKSQSLIKKWKVFSDICYGPFWKNLPFWKNVTILKKKIDHFEKIWPFWKIFFDHFEKKFFDYFEKKMWPFW